MGINALLVLLFVSLTICLWTILRFSLHGYGRYEAEFTEQAEDSFEQLFLFMDTRKVFLVNIALLLVLPLFVWLFTGSLLYVAVIVALIFLLPKCVVNWLKARRTASINAALPDVLAQLAGAMRAGSTFLNSVETMVEETSGPISQEFSLMLREQRMGRTLDESLDNLAERVASEEMDLMITAAQISRELGGNLSDIFQRLSVSLRRKQEMEGKIRALTSQGKMQGWVVSALPFLIIFALSFLEPDIMRPIFSTLLGWGFLAVIVLLEICGALMIRKIVNIDV
ncbi:MAG: type II secretion system F family protein [Pseudomonadota bacterium]